MTDLINQLAQMESSINENLKLIIATLNNTDWFGVIMPWLLSIVSGVVGYWISTANEKTKFKREANIEYLKFTNTFLGEISNIIMELVNIQKIGFILTDAVNNPSLYNQYFYGNLRDYNSIATKIRDLRKVIENLQLDEEAYSTKRELRKEFIRQSDDVLDFEKMIKICSEYQRDALNFYYLIHKDLRKEHAEIINFVAKATQNSLKEFDIEQLKKMVVVHIQNINEKIIGKKINEPNYFNVNSENNEEIKK